MKRMAICTALLITTFLALGIYVIRVEEKGVVRRFGRVVAQDDGTPVLVGSGIHWDLPWPFARVDRVNLSQVRTMRICGRPSSELPDIDLLRTAAESTEPQFLTGDKNVLNLDVTVQYRVSGERVAAYLFDEERPERRLRLLVETVLSDLISRSGVDYVHPLGLAELQASLTQRSAELVTTEGLGLEIESVSINSVAPPARVKADFLDVSNARNDQEKHINDARSYAEQRAEESRAAQYQLVSEARSYDNRVNESARATADSFRAMLEQVDSDTPESTARARKLALRRQYLDTLEAVLSAASGKVMLEGGRQVDLTILKSDQ